MNTLRFTAFALSVALLGGCAMFQPATPTAPAGPLASLVTPAALAKDTTDGTAFTVTLFLANNSSYAAEVQGVADAFTALAHSSPTTLTPADISATLAKTSLSTATRNEVNVVVSMALDLYKRDFASQLPTLKPSYALFAQAIADGLNTALGNPPVSAPVAAPDAPASPTTIPTVGSP